MSKTIALLSLFLVAVISGCDAGPDDGPATVDAQPGQQVDSKPGQQMDSKADSKQPVNSHPACQITLTKGQPWDDACTSQGLGYCNSAEINNALTTTTYLGLHGAVFSGTCQTGCYDKKDAQGADIYVSSDHSDPKSCSSNNVICTVHLLTNSHGISLSPQYMPLCLQDR